MSLNQQIEIDRICDAFEAVWRAGEQPDLQLYVQQIDPEFRSRLLAELIPQDVRFRLAVGMNVADSDYQPFGDDAVAVARGVLADRQDQAAAFDRSGPDECLDSAAAGRGNNSDPVLEPTCLAPKLSPEESDDVESFDKTNRGDEKSPTIGPYKLLQRIGQGGMGSVFMAEQTQPVRRRVALKLIKAGMDSKEIITRFEAERQALSMMDHQNIARVLDAGTTSDGRPYFVMELVNGIPITEYCDKYKLSLDDRLNLFMQACKAIQHAHQKGIIHRDIKPNNVLVTQHDGVPVVKVIDFGLAKALQSANRLTDKTMFTEFGQVVGTLQYMSPEQAEMNALDIDTRSDVYSLGILLYELLTGSTPIEKQRLKQMALDRVLVAIREEEAPRPSHRLSSSGESATGISEQRRTDPRKLGLILKGDLDWIAMKALEKDRNRRYDSALSLADDITKYLRNDTVSARPPSVRYRFRKTLRKHRLAVVIGVSFLCVSVLALGAGVFVAQYFSLRGGLESEVTIHPPSETVWGIEVVQVAEGNPDGKQMALEVENSATRRLRLLPSTLDAVTKMHAPTALKFRLKQERGVSRKVRVQLFHAADGKSFWPNAAILEFPDGTDTIDLPLQIPVTTIAAAEPSASSAAPAPTTLDFSGGLTVEITPEDLLRKITSRITIIPELAEPEQFVQRPVPSYDAATNVLEIRVDRAPVDDAGTLQPAKLPVEVVFSDSLLKYVIPGDAAPVPSLPANGHTFTIRFRPEVADVLGDEGIEFGLSLAGIPHAWWWTLSDGIQTPVAAELPQVRTFLEVVNKDEVKPVADVSVLMLGEGWQKTRLRPSVFLHGGDFDADGWQLDLYFQRRDFDGREVVMDQPFIVTNRFVETVTVTPGDNGAWMFYTTTEPYSPPPLDPVQLGLQNGSYDLIASLRQDGKGTDPVEWPVAFVLDDSGPELTKFETKPARTKVTEVLRGTIVVTDEESGVKAVRVGLLPDMLELLTITPGDRKVEAKFELDPSRGFPPLLQKETDNGMEVTLYIEAENLAGKITKMPRPVTFYLPGKM